MVAKNQKKKQSVTPFQKSRDVVKFSMNDFELTNYNTVSFKEKSSSVLKLVEALLSSTSLDEQIKSIQCHKGNIKNSLLSLDKADLAEITCTLQLLLQLYILPTFSPLRNAMEWVVETVFQIKSIDKSQVRQAIKDICLSVWNKCKASGHLTNITNASNVNDMMSWVFTINYIAILDKEYQWLTVSSAEDSSDRIMNESLEDSDLLFHFVAYIGEVFTACANIIAPPVAVAGTQSGAVSSSEVIRFAECCGETMRAIMTVLKAHKTASINTTNNIQWRAMIDNVLSSGVRILKSELVNKDVVTSTAMGVVALQWLLRSLAAGGNSTGYQLVAIIGLLNVSEVDYSKLVSNSTGILDVSVFATDSGLHPVLVQSVADLPLISKCALLRACLSIYDDAAMLLEFASVVNDSAHGTAASILSLHQNGDYSSVVNASTATTTATTTVALENIFYGAFFSSIMCVSNHSLSINRLYGFQTLESWLNRCEVLIRDQQVASTVNIHSLLHKLFVVSKMLTAAWNHPSRQLNHIVPTIYSRLVNFIAVVLSLTTAGSDAGSGSLLAPSEVWDPLVQQSLAMPSQHRGKYQTMNLLLPHVGATLFLTIQPDIIKHLVEAVQERDISSSASNFIGSLLTAYQKETGTDKPLLRNLWDKFVVDAVCSLSSRMRNNSADYLVPELLRFDTSAGPHLIHLIRNGVVREGSDFSSKLWGLVNICLQARLKGLPGKDIAFAPSVGGVSIKNDCDSESLLTEHELVMSCLSNDDELRLVSLTVLTVSLKSASPVSDEELNILKYALQYSLKSPESDHRLKVTRVVKTLLSRLNESSRVHEKEIKKLERALNTLAADKAKLLENNSIDNTTAMEVEVKSAAEDGKEVVTPLTADEIDGKVAQTEELLEVSRKIVDSCFSVCLWLRDELLANLYPGTSSDREVMSLELIRCLFDTLGATAPQLQCFNTTPVIHTLLNLFVSSWDRSRKMAADLLLKFPHPLTGYQNNDTVMNLLNWGVQLAGSPRLRESDAGALLIRDVYHIYCMKLGWELQIPSFVNAAAVKDNDRSSKDATRIREEALAGRLHSDASKSAKCALFIHSMCDNLSERLQRLDALFSTLNINEICQLADNHDNNSKAGTDVKMSVEESAAEAIPLCHGLILSLRFCLLDSNTADMFSAPVDSAVTGDNKESNYWQEIIRRVYRQTLYALKVAMTIVAEAPSDVPFAPVPFALSCSVDSNATVPLTTEVTMAAAPSAPSAGSMAASYINTNSIMGSGTGDEAVDERGSAVQRAVVAAWLLVKEASSLLATLVDISPPINEQQSETVVEESNHAVAAPTADEKQDKKRVCRRNGKESALAPKATLPLLTVDDISHAGSIILEALGRLKHMGAIAEAHSALQSISATVLRHGERSTQLCRLPALWLNSVLTRLAGEQQVFILRRSAGFAYSFLSLLRAEPANCKPTLLPVAMTSLLYTIEQGLLETIPAEDGAMAVEVNLEESSRWKLSVHALNVVRLILCDAAVGPDVDAFIAKSTELAVRGFSSTKWAVRNSSMMVFSAVVQRAVDNDKNDSGGASAATAAEFFQRFPSLFPFLLGELAKVTKFTVNTADNWPVSIHKTENSVVNYSEEVHPSLYPLLLLISKLRAAMVNTTPTAAELTVAETNALAQSGAAAQAESAQVADISLFVPMVESCSPQRVQQVRTMSAKALVALVPLRDVPAKAERILSSLIASLQTQTAATRVPTNTIHGALLLVQEVLFGLHRHVCGNGVTDKTFFYAVQRELFDSVLPLLEIMVDLLKHNKCAALHTVLLKSLRTVRDLVQSTPEHYAVANAIVIKHCGYILKDTLSSQSTSSSVPLVYEPVLWREAVSDLVWYSFSPDFGTLAHTSTGSDKISVVHAALLLDHPVSEVREGVLLGCQKVLNSPSCNIGSETPTVFSKQHLGSAIFLEKLFHRAQEESEPPVLQLTMEILVSITRRIPNVAYPEATREQIHASGVDVMGSLISRQWTHKDFDQLPGDKIELCLNYAAASALEVMGWIVAERLHHLHTTRVCCSVSLRIVAKWAAVLRVAAHEDQINTMRESAAASILLSSVLPAINQAVLGANGYDLESAREIVKIGVQVWIVVLTLLQDDDYDVRDIANSVCSQALDAYKGTKSPEQSCIADNLPVGFVTNECFTLEHVSDNLAALLSASVSKFGSTVALQYYTVVLAKFQDMVGSVGTVQTLLEASNETISQKIFEAEQANLYIEQIKGANVFSVALCNSLRTVSDSTVVSFVTEALLSQATTALQLLIQSVGKLDWVVGGATYQKDVFQYLFLSLDAFVRCLSAVNADSIAETNTILLADIAQFQDKVSTFIAAMNTNENCVHPMVLKLVKAMERK